MRNTLRGARCSIEAAKEGKILYGGPDHYARLAATKHLRDFLAAGRPPAPKQEEKVKGGMTLYQLQELIKAEANPDTDWDTVIPPY